MKRVRRTNHNWLRDGTHRFPRLTVLLLLINFLQAGSWSLSIKASDEGVRIPDYSRWQLEEEATTYRPGTDLQFYALELRSYSNPERPVDKVVELRRHDVLYILYTYTFTENRARWNIYMDAGFADAPCGFFDPKGKPADQYVRIDLSCLRDTERVDLRSGQ